MWWYIKPFRYSNGAWQTDRRTEGQADTPLITKLRICIADGRATKNCDLTSICGLYLEASRLVSSTEWDITSCDTVNVACGLRADSDALPKPTFSDNLIYENRRDVKHVVSHPIQQDFNLPEVTFQPITLTLKRGATSECDACCRVSYTHVQ